MLTALIIVGTIANGFTNQGAFIESANALDFAIAGDGWIPLQQKDGKLVYTRYGQFGMDHEGFISHVPSGLPLVIVNAQGEAEKINIANRASKPRHCGTKDQTAKLIQMSWGDEGTLDFLYNDGDAVPVVKLKLAAFENQRQLKLLDAKTHLFSAPASVGEIAYAEPATAPLGKINRRYLEGIPPERYLQK